MYPCGYKRTHVLMCVCTSVQGGRENERQGGRVGENTKPVTYPTDRLTAERERERERENKERERERERDIPRASERKRECARARERERERERRYNPKNPKLYISGREYPPIQQTSRMPLPIIKSRRHTWSSAVFGSRRAASYPRVSTSI
jgi:hypothetical protein